MAVNSMPSLSRTKTSPIPVLRSNRRLDLRILTSIPVGKVVPIAAFGLLREDQVQSSRVRVNFEMLETVEILMNAVNVNVKAYLVPFMAFDRFDGIDALNRSYEKEMAAGATQIIPFITQLAFNRSNQPVHTYMGKHARDGQMVNGAYVEAYNTIWNFRAANRSPDITKRTLVDCSLAKAFWQHQQFAHIVPDFDQAIIDGEVPLNVVSSSLKVNNKRSTGTPTPNANHGDLMGFVTGGNTSASPGPQSYWPPASGTVPVSDLREATFRATPTISYPYADLSQVFAEMQEDGITVSLSNIELARKTQAFAALRKQYTGHTDEFIIDLLMDGITVPEQQWRQPMLLADRSTIFGMAKRYASSAEDLTASVVNGATFIDLPIVTPRVPTGGVVMITVEITPEQLFERQQDVFLHTLDQDRFPQFLQDTLDPEKVEVVTNEYIDVSHATPTATFGYAPLNHKWNAHPPGIGGKFYRPTVDAPTDEARQRIWAVETANPTLAEDFYLCTNMHQKPFVVTNQDNFEAVCRGLIGISGNTVFGNVLVEASDDYETVMGMAPTDRIVKPASLEAKEGQEGASDEPGGS